MLCYIPYRENTTNNTNRYMARSLQNMPKKRDVLTEKRDGTGNFPYEYSNVVTHAIFELIRQINFIRGCHRLAMHKVPDRLHLLTSLICPALMPGPETISGTWISNSYNCRLSFGSDIWPRFITEYGERGGSQSSGAHCILAPNLYKTKIIGVRSIW